MTVEALTDQRNYAVTRLPQRHFPGVVVQGDSLSTLVGYLRDALAAIRSGDTDVAVAVVGEVLETLEGVQRDYEAALRATASVCPTESGRSTDRIYTRRTSEPGSDPPSHPVR
jgi:hypothetical protein